MQAPQFVYVALSNFPRLVRALVMRVTPQSSEAYARLCWDIIDYTDDPDTLWDDLYSNYRGK